MAGAAATVLRATAGHRGAADHRGAAGAPERADGVEQLRVGWLTALEVRGVRPFLEEERERRRGVGAAGGGGGGGRGGRPGGGRGG
ncbi:hypothetical protein SVTN_24045 [Streptomyces vietnamensis]|uniref:Uncharacterized protein n=1 Tax=Streptomyces vietnamensis TaxID=362257 RepID=A0A0B5I949_9ACTN|nr:hypothetical protein SVTN_24045 [Streptomyces vietnamensis]